MRLYKANLNSQYEVISYVAPNEIEEVYSVRSNATYDICLESLYDYIELSGSMTFPLKDVKDNIFYTMYVDIDHKFTNWEGKMINYVIDQIQYSIRQNIIDNFFHEDESFIGKSDLEEQNTIGIIGENEILLDKMTYLYHNNKGGIWESSNPDIVSIDKYNGIIKGNKLGTATITYQVDTGYGMLTCFKKIEVIYE
jgi:hypothetical protein